MGDNLHLNNNQQMSGFRFEDINRNQDISMIDDNTFCLEDHKKEIEDTSDVSILEDAFDYAEEFDVEQNSEIPFQPLNEISEIMLQNDHENSIAEDFQFLKESSVMSNVSIDKLNKLSKGTKVEDLKKSKKEKQLKLNSDEKKQLEAMNREEYFLRTLTVSRSKELGDFLRTKNLYTHQEKSAKELTSVDGKIMKARSVLTEKGYAEAYENADLARQLGITTTLHHSQGTKLLNEGHNVLEFNVAGSSFYGGFRREASGIKGRRDDEIADTLVEKKGKLKLKKSKRDESEVNRMYDLVYGKEYPLYRGTEAEFQNVDLNSEEIEEKRIKGVRYKDRVNERTGSVKRKITIPGVDGAQNTGTFAIDKVRVYIRDMGADYLTQVFRSWEESGLPLEQIKDVYINLEGHSRGAVASTLGAMTLRGWIADNYPQYLSKVKFNLIAHDPVPGSDADSLYRREVDIKHKIGGETTDPVMKLQKGDSKMMPLEDCANTTVFYALSSKKGAFAQQFFDPMKVKGANRIIITTTGHESILKSVDTSQYKGKDGKLIDSNEKAHNFALTDASTGEVYRGTGINELPGGVYLMDELGTLVKINSMEDFKKITDSLSSFRGEKERRNRIHDVADSFFKEHSAEKVQDYDQYKSELKNLYTKSLQDSKGKSDLYKAMEQSIKTLQQGDTVDNLINALQKVRNYINNRSGFHFTTSGSERIKLAKDFETLLSDKLAKSFEGQDYKEQKSIITKIRALKNSKNKEDTKVINSLIKILSLKVTDNDSLSIDAVETVLADKTIEKDARLKIDDQELENLEGELTGDEVEVNRIAYDHSNPVFNYAFDNVSLEALINNVNGLMGFNGERYFLNYPEFLKFRQGYKNLLKMRNMDLIPTQARNKVNELEAFLKERVLWFHQVMKAPYSEFDILSDRNDPSCPVDPDDLFRIVIDAYHKKNGIVDGNYIKRSVRGPEMGKDRGLFSFSIEFMRKYMFNF